MKNNRHGKAAIFKSSEIARIRKNMALEHHRCIFEIALFTGERMGAITQLQTSDVYADPQNRIPHDEITFQARTRKARNDGSRETRQIAIHPDLKGYLATYQPPEGGYLFPSKRNKPTEANKHITRRAVDKYWREMFLKLGYDKRGFSTHSTRRGLITRLDRNGVSVKVIKQITGHKNTDVLIDYIEADRERVKNALSGIEI